MNKTSRARDFSARAFLLEHLELVRDQVADGEQHIAEQKQLIGSLKGDGRAMMGAIEFLSALEITQALRVTHCYRLEQALETANPE
jgi:hypothetical protein